MKFFIEINLDHPYVDVPDEGWPVSLKSRLMEIAAGAIENKIFAMAQPNEVLEMSLKMDGTVVGVYGIKTKEAWEQ